MRQLPELLVIRHGETEWNFEGRFQGHLDSPLTERGRAQAEGIGRTLAALGVSGTSHALLSSPQGRCLQTARIALDGLREAGLKEDPRLREIDLGAWAGALIAPLVERHLRPDDSMLDLYSRAPKAETLDAVWDRVSALLIEQRRPTVMFTHGLTSRLLRTRAMGFDVDRIEELPGGQGVIFRIVEGRHEVIDAA